MALTPEQAQHYIDVMNHHIVAAKVASKQGGAQGGALEDTFCSTFKQAEPLLQQMAGLVAWWPSYGVVAAAILKGFLTLGDELYATGCAPTTTQTPPTP